jgi:hypothetical protein
MYPKDIGQYGKEKAAALVYIYTNSGLLRKRPSVDPVHYYDDKIISEDSNDDGGTLFDTNDDNNNDNSGKRP